MPETEPYFHSIDKDQELSQKYQVVKNYICVTKEICSPFAQLL